MAEYVDSAVQTVLSSSRLMLAHPGNAKLTQVYPTPSETTSVLAQALNHRGQFRVKPNNKQFNSRSDFILSSSALVSEMTLVGNVSFANGGAGQSWKPNCVGWIFDMVESMEVTYSNSLMQNMIIRGQTLKDYCLLCCCTKQERIDMLKAAGQSFQLPGNGPAVKNVFRFALPLSFLNHTPASLRNSWPVDGSVLAGPIQISVNWRSFAFGFVATDTAVAAIPTEFAELEMVCKTTQLQDAAFSVKKAMMLDPQLVYSLPARYITTVDYTRALNAGQPTTINLASAPSGMLEGIIISIRPKIADVSWVTPDPAGGTVNIHGGSCTVAGIQLQFGGQNIFRCESYEEYLHWQRSAFGDTVEWVEQTYLQGAANTDLSVAIVHPVYFIPMCNDSAAIFRAHTNENLPSYGGSQLQLTIQTQIAQRTLAAPGTSWDGAEVIGAVAQTNTTEYEILVAYLVSSLLEISQGTVDLQL